MKILIDAMGGDNAPDDVLKGAVKAINEIESEIVLVGNTDILNKKVKEIFNKNDISEISNRIKIHHTSEIIEMDDTPTDAIRNKKDSSMVVGLNMLKERAGDVFISAGNSGALLTGATLLVGRIKGIDRPAIAPMLPSYKKSIMLMDAGANTNCKPINLVQFAQMGNIYLKNTFKMESPVVGLLNIGTEETKGNDLVKEVYNELKQNAGSLGINFIGNIEGRDLFTGEIDLAVTDGFTGNMILKTIEGLGKLVKTNLIDSLTKNIFTKIGAIGALPAIGKFKKSMDYKEYGGALFLGVQRPVVKAHGSSDEKLFYTTIKQAEKFAKEKSVDTLIEKI